MTDNLSRPEDNLAKAVLEIVATYQPILTEDIWYELGEDDDFQDGIALAEVGEILQHLENEERVRRDDGKWRLRELSGFTGGPGAGLPATPGGSGT